MNSVGRFPSGQREQTVNLPSQTSMVRIHPCPPFFAGMAELADALDSGSSESNFMQVQVLFPAPNKSFRENGSFYFLQRNIKAKTGLEEAVVNQATVWPESGADRAAASFKQEFSPVFYNIRGFQENRKLFCLIIMKDPFPKHQRNIFSFDRKKSRTSENSWPFPIKFSFCPINHTARHSLAQQAYYPLNADKFCTWRQSSV